jgi:hypothetical protein
MGLPIEKLNCFKYKLADFAFKSLGKAVDSCNSPVIKINIEAQRDEAFFLREKYFDRMQVKRLSPQSAISLMSEKLSEVQSQLTSFESLVTRGIGLLKSGNIGEYMMKCMPELEIKMRILKMMQERISQIPNFMGFDRPEDAQKASEFLEAICRASGSDRAILKYSVYSPMYFYHRFSEKDKSVLMRVPLKALFMATAENKQAAGKEGTDAAKALGLKSGYNLLWWDGTQKYREQFVYLFKQNGQFSESDIAEAKKAYSANQDTISSSFAEVMGRFDLACTQLMHARHDSGVYDINDYQNTMQLLIKNSAGDATANLDTLNGLRSKIPLSLDKNITWLDILNNGGNYKTVNIPYFVYTASELHRSRFAEKGLFLNVKIADSDIPIACDTNILSNVINNLIGNARKYTDFGGVTIEVYKGETINKTSRVTQRVFIKITDTGIGIPQEELKKLFNRGFRASNAKEKTAVKGSGEGLDMGIGLNYVYEALKGLDSDIEVASELGKGTTFTISFPIVG